MYVVDTAGGHEALAIADELRAAGLSADRSFDQRSMKAQMKAADRSGADVAVIVGPDEVAAGVVTLRALRDERPAGDRGPRRAGRDREEVVAGMTAIVRPACARTSAGPCGPSTPAAP